MFVGVQLHTPPGRLRPPGPLACGYVRAGLTDVMVTFVRISRMSWSRRTDLTVVWHLRFKWYLRLRGRKSSDRVTGVSDGGNLVSPIRPSERWGEFPSSATTSGNTGNCLGTESYLSPVCPRAVRDGPAKIDYCGVVRGKKRILICFAATRRVRRRLSMAIVVSRRRVFLGRTPTLCRLSLRSS